MFLFHYNMPNLLIQVYSSYVRLYLLACKVAGRRRSFVYATNSALLLYFIVVSLL